MSGSAVFVAQFWCNGLSLGVLSQCWDGYRRSPFCWPIHFHPKYLLAYSPKVLQSLLRSPHYVSASYLNLSTSSQRMLSIFVLQGFPFLFQQIKDCINLHQTRNLIFSLCRWNERLANQIVAMIFTAIHKFSDVSAFDLSLWNPFVYSPKPL